MICLDDTDLIEGDAEAAAEVDYTIHGIIGSTFTQLAAGQLPNAKGTLYTAGAATSVVCITLVNTGAAAQDVNLYLDPAAGGNSRRMIPEDVSLGIGYSLHFDGQRCSVLNADGQLLCGFPSPLGPTKGGTGLAAYTQGDLLYASAANVLGALGIGTANFKKFVNAAGTAPEWAKGLKVLAKTYNVATATGTQAVTGIGFKPSAVILIGNVDGTDNWSFGFSDGTTEGLMGKASATAYSTATMVMRLYVDGTNYQTGVINSFDVDGFTIGWTKILNPVGTGFIKILAFR